MHLDRILIVGEKPLVHSCPADPTENTRDLRVVNRALRAEITRHRESKQRTAELNADLERRLAECTEELALARRGFENLVGFVSHDLTSPLRGIDGWSLALLEECGAQLDAQGKKYLATVRLEAQRMAELLEELLQLARPEAWFGERDGGSERAGGQMAPG